MFNVLYKNHNIYIIYIQQYKFNNYSIRVYNFLTQSSNLSFITTMFAFILVVTQILFLAFVGGFARTTQTFTQSYYLSTNILFLLAWTLMNSPFKKLTLTSLTILILTIALTVQCNLLFGRFWYNVFNQFTTSYQLTIEIFIQCTVAVFVILLITIDYIGIFRYWQIYMLIVPIVNFIWTFNHAILRYGLKIFDGGCGMDGFLFSGVVTLTLWAFAVRARHKRYGGYAKDSQNISIKQNMYKRQQYYNGYSISLFGGLIGTFILWPQFNSSLATLSSKLSIVDTTILSSSIFANSAYSNTILALSIGTSLSFTLSARNGTHEQKQKIRSAIDCFINSGIICASFIDISLNPAAVMTMALLASILTFILYWYYQSLYMKQGKTAVVSNFMILVLYFSRAIFRVLLTLIGCIVAAIVVSNRQYSSVPLLNTTTYGSTIYAKTAGLEIAGYFVTFGLSLIAGILCGLAVNLFHSYKQNQTQKLQKTTETQQKNTPQKKPLKQNQLIHVQPSGFPDQNSPNILKKLTFQKFKQTQLTDYSFLQFGQLDSQIFPLFHSSNDTYNDQQQIARKMLKQVMLSHIKNNYISTNNYISINKNKNTLTNNTIQKKSPQKLNRSKTLQIQNQYIFKNDHDSAKKIQYKNRLGQSTPKSGKSQIKNQTKYIVQLVNRDREIQLNKQKIIEREPMPQFYIDHIYKKNKTQNNSQTNSQIIIKTNPQMNRSNTQKYIKPASIKKANTKQPLQPQQIKPTKNLLPNNQLKKTKSLSFINLPQPLQSKKQTNIQIPIISQHQKQQQEYRSKNINKSNNNNTQAIPTQTTNINNNNNISISRKLDFSQPLKLTKSSYQNKKQIKQIIKDDGSQILSQNQHISQENQNSQII